MRISDLAKLTNTSPRMLRHYDEIGLFKPARTYPNGYREYSVAQLPELNRILALKDLGFTLEQILALLHEQSPERLREMLIAQESELKRRLELEQSRLGRLRAHLRDIELEADMTEFLVTLKQIEPVLVASVRNESLVKRYDEGGMDISRHYETLYGFVGDHAADPQINLWHGNEERLEPEVTTALKERMHSSNLVRVYELPAIPSAASVTFCGHYADAGMMQAFKALHRWVESNQYREVGPVRQVFHPIPNDTQVMDIEFKSLNLD
jgi:DNA-binding transcriptional MerR regulator/effector-binding domain-containing protein